jgi:hypothetical protein
MAVFRSALKKIGVINSSEQFFSKSRNLVTVYYYNVGTFRGECHSTFVLQLAKEKVTNSDIMCKSGSRPTNVYT